MDQNWESRELPGSPVVRTQHFHCGGGPGSIPGQGIKNPQATRHNQKKKKSNNNKKTESPETYLYMNSQLIFNKSANNTIQWE